MLKGTLIAYMELNDEKEVLKQARKELDNRLNCPDGYIECRLSTQGKIGAPPVFHIRNFSTADVVNLNLTEQSERPLKLIKILDDLIYEKDVSIKNFHHKEVIELLCLMYECFFTTILPEQTWELTEEDWEFLKETSGGEDSDEFRNKKRALETGAWKPTFDINLSNDLQFYEINPNIKINAKVEKNYKGSPFSATFSLPRFGDVHTLKSFIDLIYKEKDKQFARLSEMVRFRKEAEEKLLRGENIVLSSIPSIPKAEEERLKEYETEKSLFIFRATIAMYLIEFDGEDLTNVPLEKKIELASDPRLDFSTFQLVQQKFEELQFGLKEEITVLDPIINKVVTRKYTFRLDTILNSFGSAKPAETNVSFV